MSGVDIQRLEALTHNYAEFDSRKSGLATALGGVMALIVGLNLIHPIRVLAGPWWHIQAALVFLMPVLWLPLKQILFRRLYRGLGPVKAIPDLAQERAKWRWSFSIAMVLMTFQTLALLGFVSGFAGVLRQPETIRLLSTRLPGVWQSWLWVAALPWLYLVLAPWWIKGVEEARAYLISLGPKLNPHSVLLHPRRRERQQGNQGLDDPGLHADPTRRLRLGHPHDSERPAGA